MNEEKNIAFDNLKEKAIKKLNQMSGNVGKSQQGNGILFGKIHKHRKRPLKTKKHSKKKQTATSSKIGRTSDLTLSKSQIGRGKKKKRGIKKKKKNQVGKGKKIKCTSKKVFFDPKAVQYSILKREEISLETLNSIENATIITFSDRGYSDDR